MRLGATDRRPDEPKDSPTKSLREQTEMEVWRNERMDMIVQKKLAPFRHLTGMLRHVFPMNVLTTPHLQREVSGRPLAE
jgi:hypothetical protein